MNTGSIKGEECVHKLRYYWLLGLSESVSWIGRYSKCTKNAWSPTAQREMCGTIPIIVQISLIMLLKVT